MLNSGRETRIMVQNRYLSASFLATGVLVPLTAYADAGVPMIFLTVPGMTLALLPIILIEAFILKRLVAISNWQSIGVSGAVNLLSTYVGLPLTWALLVFVQLITGGDGVPRVAPFWQKFLAVTWQAPWLVPYDKDLDWMLPTATLVLLVPFYFVSVIVERLLAQRLLRQCDRATVRGAIVRGNQWTYGLLAIFVLGWLALAVMSRGGESRSIISRSTPVDSLWSGKI